MGTELVQNQVVTDPVRLILALASLADPVLAVLQLLYTESATAEWLFLQEKAALNSTEHPGHAGTIQ